MQSVLQILGVMTFLVYSLGYLAFVAWASDKSAGRTVRLRWGAALLVMIAALTPMGLWLLI